MSADRRCRKLRRTALVLLVLGGLVSARVGDAQQEPPSPAPAVESGAPAPQKRKRPKKAKPAPGTVTPESPPAAAADGEKAAEPSPPPPGQGEEVVKPKRSGGRGRKSGEELGSSGVTEVVVTAQKRKQKAQDVPISMGVLNEEFIEDSHLTDMRRLQEYVPNLQIQPITDSRSTTIRIRGIGTPGTNSGFDPSVGTFIDGVYQGRPGMSVTDLLDIERIEVLRGPQGTLYGKNTSAGLINVISQKPKFVYEGVIEGDYGNYNLWEGRGSINVPIVPDRVAARLSAYTVTRDGYDTNPLTGQQFNDQDKYGAKLRTLVNLTPDAELLLTGDYSFEDNSCCAPALITTNGYPNLSLRFRDIAQVTGIPEQPVDPFGRHIYSNAPTENQVQIGGVSGELNWRLGTHTLTNLAAYRIFNSDSRFDGDFTQYDSVFQSTQENFYQVSNELRLASPGGQALEYVAGIYFYYSNDDTVGLTGIGRDWIRTASTGAFPEYDAATRNLIHLLGASLQTAANADGQVFNTDDNTFKTTNVAGFGQATYHLNEQWSLTGGLRLMWEKKTRVGTQTSAFKIDAGIFGPNLFADQEREVINAAPMGSLRFFPDPDKTKMLFLTVARGFKSGGFNQLRTQGGLNTEFNDETATDFEIGAKTQWLSRRLTANATFFYTLYDDFQAQTFDGSSFAVRNAGSLTTYGVEGDLVEVLHPSLLMGQGFGFNHARYDTFTGAQCTAAQVFLGNGSFAGTKGNPFASNGCVQNLDGQPLDNAPEWTISLWAQYERELPWTLPLLPLMGFLRTEWNYRDRFFLNQDLDPNLVQPPVNLVNIRGGLRDPNDRWEVTFWSENVTDAGYHVIAFDIPIHNGFAGVVAPPRTYGVTVRLRF